MKSKLIIIFTLISIVIIAIFVLFKNNNKTINHSIEYAKADVYETTGTMSKLMSRQSTLTFETYDHLDSTNITIDVDINNQKQQFDGFGVALTHSSAYLLTQEGTEEIADEILDELFSSSGAHLGLVRIPIGASDFIENNYFFTCDDLNDINATDLSLEHFSIEHDLNIIKILKKIIVINPDVQIFACPWSAPSWMKQNQSLLGGELDENYYDVYVNYLVKFVEMYNQKGIKINYLSLVNEPLVNSVQYPHMYMSESTAFILAEKLAKQLKKQKLDVDILGWEHNVSEAAFSYADSVLNDKNSSFDGFAYHGYNSVDDYTIDDGCEYISNNYNNQKIFMTEITEHSGSNDFMTNLVYAGKYVTISPLNNGLNGLLYWNMVLKSDGTPQAINNQDNHCYGVIDLELKNNEYYYYKRSSYYAMAHISKFAYPIESVYPDILGITVSNTLDISACAIRRADGVIVVCAINHSDYVVEDVKVVINGKSFSYNFQPNSIVTFVVGFEDNNEPYVSSSISQIDIVQKQKNTFEYTVKSDLLPSEKTKVFITKYDKINNDLEPIDYIAEDGKFIFTKEVDDDFYFIQIVEENKKVIMAINRPQMEPSLISDERGNILTYNFINGTSWSSFCDQTGKAIYRSESSVFNEDAILIEEKINMLESNVTIDFNPNMTEPYYFIVLSSKNGIVRYISLPYTIAK